MTASSIQIRPTQGDEWAAVRLLFRQYLSELDFDLDFQDVERELQDLPGPYAAPQGVALLAVDAPGGSQYVNDTVTERAVGVVALKPLDPEPNGDRVCEMKRLYVRPEFRGQGLGSQLAEAILREARERGYNIMRLDTVASMTAARSVYQDLGFVEREAYYHNPLDDVVYYERRL
ncbi:GNAT family N-acetyltransferase [Longibacter salinarum]|uniref:GNAT family N-acetyltransferase n=1 Tax=Longibacter salinarum TaxID=1850348 RepID=A0A2A8CZB0_9BACT|nr:GNAT family N-acetyltransferase [Longibacter salinarum]PEN13964.1 GNAT family N-acetyltransferase [Longibacter salinarum]